MYDKCGRKIDYLRISVTDLCNLRCKYCIPEKGIALKSHEDILRLEEIERIVREAAGLGITKVRITGGEPLVRRGIVELIGMISQIEEIKDIALTTNGLLLKNLASELKKAGLKRVNISIDSLNERKYCEITRGGSLKDALMGIEAAKESGLVPIKLNVVLIGGFNDDEIEDFVNLTVNEEQDVRFIELMPVGEAGYWSGERFISNRTVLERIPELVPVFSRDVGSPAKYYMLPGAKGKVGLINPISSHFCMSCNRIRLTADGKLKPCLHSDQEVDIRGAVRTEGGQLSQVIERAVGIKPTAHRITEEEFTPVKRNMHQIGG